MFVSHRLLMVSLFLFVVAVLQNIIESTDYRVWKRECQALIKRMKELEGHVGGRGAGQGAGTAVSSGYRSPRLSHLSRHHTSPYVITRIHTLPLVTTRHHKTSHVTTNHHTSPHVFTSPHVTTHHHTSPQVCTHHHTSPHVSTRLHTSTINRRVQYAHVGN